MTSQDPSFKRDHKRSFFSDRDSQDGGRTAGGHVEGSELLEDRRLVRRIRDGDEDAFSTLVESHIGGMTQFASSMLRSEDAADDIVQNVFVWIWSNRNGLNIKGRLKPYLFRAVRNRVLDLRKAESVRESHRVEVENTHGQGAYYGQSFNSNPEESVITAETVRIAISKLSERRQLAIRLRLNEGLSYGEIAEILEISEENAARLVTRALTDLRKFFKEVSD